MAYFIPCNKIVTRKETARFFIDDIYKYQRLPNDIIFDCGIQFTSKFWQSLFKILQVEIKLSFVFNPQIGGLTEQHNQVLEQYLQCTINYYQHN